MDNTALNHLERIESRTVNKFTPERVPEWIEKHTKIDGANYSFKDHEYQAEIVSDTSRTVVIRKCSQIGMTEASSRYALAMVAVVPNYKVIYTMPAASEASKFMQSRLDPIIKSSAFLSEMLDRNLDNSEVKRIGDSYLYMRGCTADTAAISVPADHLIHDEIDFSSEEIITKYQSRLTHSPHKRRTLLSTPTLPNTGIDKEFRSSVRHFNFCKCCHCGHFFIPDYYNHVVIPQFTGDLRDIDKNTLRSIRWREAKLLCPSCGMEPDLNVGHREWVAENPSDNYEAKGYQVSPFDAPNIHLRGDDPQPVVPFLIQASTVYKRRADFVNFNLGQPMGDEESSLLENDIRNMIVQTDSSGHDGSYVFGLDMGKICHLVIGKVLEDGKLAVKTKTIKLLDVQKERQTLASLYWPRVSIADSLPYTETILRMQEVDINLWGAFYGDWKSAELFKPKDKDKDDSKGIEGLQEVHINRNSAFDSLMADIRNGNIIKISDEHDEAWVEQLQDMKRMVDYTKDGEMKYVWKKTKGNDHFHNALLYCYIAAKMMGVSRNRAHIPRPIRSFRMRS